MQGKKPGRNTAVKLTLVLLGVAYYMAASHLAFLSDVLGFVTGVLRPLLIGLVVAYLANPMIKWLNRRIANRPLCVLITAACGIGFVAFLLYLIVPQLVSSISGLVNSIPFYFNQLQSLLQWFGGAYGVDITSLTDMMGSYVEFASAWLETITNNLPSLLKYGQAFGSYIAALFTGLFFSLYVMLDKDGATRRARKVTLALLPPRQAELVLRIVHTCHLILRRYFINRLSASLIIGILSAAVLTICGVPYALLFGTIMGVAHIVPLFGPLVSGISCFLLLLVLSPARALIFAVVILVLNQIDYRIISPSLEGSVIGLEPAWSLFALVMGGYVGGLGGMILAIPLTQAFFVLMGQWFDSRLLEKGIDAYGLPLPVVEVGGETVLQPEPDETWVDTELPERFNEVFQAARGAAADLASRLRDGGVIDVPLQVEEPTITDLWGDDGKPPQELLDYLQQAAGEQPGEAAASSEPPSGET